MSHGLMSPLDVTAFCGTTVQQDAAWRKTHRMVAAYSDEVDPRTDHHHSRLLDPLLFDFCQFRWIGKFAAVGRRLQLGCLQDTLCTGK